MKTVVISVHQGLVMLESCPNDVEVVLHDYDLNEIEKDNPDREYREDELGTYEVSELL